MKIKDLPLNQRRDVFLEVADWLEARSFKVTGQDGTSGHDVSVASDAWYDGYRRASFELRSAVLNSFAVEVPDDLSELL